MTAKRNQVQHVSDACRGICDIGRSAVKLNQQKSKDDGVGNCTVVQCCVGVASAVRLGDRMPYNKAQPSSSVKPYYNIP